MASNSNTFTNCLIIQLGGNSYWLRTRVEHLLPTSISLPTQGRLSVPAVIISLTEPRLSLEIIKDKFLRFAAEDDVFNDKFTFGGYLLVQHKHPQINEVGVASDIASYLDGRSTILLQSNSSLPEGPYFTCGREIHQAWRLHPDRLSAFVTGVVPEDGNFARFQSFNANPIGEATPAIAVPSRLYFHKTEELPLSGVRISVKDNMHLAGIITTLGSRSYTELYGTQDNTSEYIDLLIQRGAVIVGKTKLSAWAGSEIPPDQCIDYFPPWNPRGDGYQGPSGSSSGAGASAAGYPWLDVSLCTDTTGSMRHPASSHGTWGHRVSWGTLSLKNVVPAVPAFDTFGILSRDSERILELINVSSPKQAFKQPSKILYPTDWYPCGDKGQQKMNENFLAALESYLGLSHTKISLSEEWSKTGPEEVRDIALKNYITKALQALNLYHGYHSFDDFRSEYRAKFNKQPYVSPAHKARWDKGAKVTNEESEEGLEAARILRQWSAEYVWRTEDDDEGPVLMIVPQGRPGANYRDVPLPPPSGPPNSYNPVFTASLLGVPQIVIPIGQNPYESKVSGIMEYAPIMTSLIGPNGYDVMLLKIADQTLRKAGWPRIIQTGQLMFELGDNDRNSQLSYGESKF